MLISKIKNIQTQIRNYGLADFILLKGTEFFYKNKLRLLGVFIPVPTNNVSMLNQVSLKKDSKANQSTHYREIKRGFDNSGISYENINLLDIGCGFGKVLSFGMIQNVKQVMGIDLDQAALDIANANCKKLQDRGYNTMHTVCKTDAGKFEIPAEINLVFMANPFGPDTMNEVLDNFISHCNEHQKELHVVYSVPAYQHVFTNRKECIKMYESFNPDNTKSQMVIFKIRA